MCALSSIYLERAVGGLRDVHMRGRSLHRWKKTVSCREKHVYVSCVVSMPMFVFRSEEQALGTEEGAEMLGEYV